MANRVFVDDDALLAQRHAFDLSLRLSLSPLVCDILCAAGEPTRRLRLLDGLQQGAWVAQRCSAVGIHTALHAGPAGAMVWA